MKTTSLEGKVLAWPVRVWGERGRLAGRGGSVITQEFHAPSHLGVDIAIAGHYTDHELVGEVVALEAGRVAQATVGERGHYVLLDHGDWASGYLHLGALDVTQGDAVQRGQRLGQMGADPLDAEGIVHLHLQLAPGGVPVDPAPYLSAASSPAALPATAAVPR